MRGFLRFGQLTLKSLIFLAAVLAALVFVLFALARSNGITANHQKTDPLLNRYLQRSLVGVNIYTAPGVVAPTNKWFSSLAFQQPSEPVFAWPLALQTTPTGFALSQPRISAGVDSVTAPFTADITASVGNQIAQTVTGYDDLSVSFRLSDQQRPVLDGRLSRGSPYLFLNLRAGQSLNLASSSYSLAPAGSDQVVFTSGVSRYGLVAGRGAKLEIAANTLSVRAGNNAEVAIFAVPAGADFGQFASAAAHPITQTAVTSVASHGKLINTYSLTTKDHQPTLFGLLPFANQAGGQSYGNFATLEGTQTVHRGTSFSFSSPLTTPPDSLPVAKLPAANRRQLEQLVAADAATLKLDQDESYFAGKQLYRAAQLLQLAKQLGLTAQANTIQAQLKTRLADWFDPAGYEKRLSRYFYYDNNLNGLVGVKADFGSDAFNDHHFHYGYFLEAASILAKYDPRFLSQNRASVDMLAKDIINTDRSDPNFPYIRTFDAYVGHSWASGFGLFADGQNQESSSEAVNAWYGAYEWGRASGNQQLRDMALALYTRESQAARAYWLGSPGLPGYAHGIVPLVWSGKLDYATFFSDDPAAKLGIQLIPMSPGSVYLRGAGDTATPAALTSLSAELAGRPPGVFADYLLMYQALYDPATALSKLSQIHSTDIDGADSLSYLYAFVYSQNLPG